MPGFDAGSITATLNLDTTPFFEELDKAQAAADEFAATPIVKHLILDKSEFDAGLAEAASEAAAASEGTAVTVSAQVVMDPRLLANQLAGIVRDAQAITHRQHDPAVIRMPLDLPQPAQLAQEMRQTIRSLPYAEVMPEALYSPSAFRYIAASLRPRLREMGQLASLPMAEALNAALYQSAMGIGDFAQLTIPEIVYHLSHGDLADNGVKMARLEIARLLPLVTELQGRYEDLTVPLKELDQMSLGGLTYAAYSALGPMERMGVLGRVRWNELMSGLPQGIPQWTTGPFPLPEIVPPPSFEERLAAQVARGEFRFLRQPTPMLPEAGDTGWYFGPGELSYAERMGTYAEELDRARMGAWAPPAISMMSKTYAEEQAARRMGMFGHIPGWRDPLSEETLGFSPSDWERLTPAAQGVILRDWLAGQGLMGDATGGPGGPRGPGIFGRMFGYGEGKDRTPGWYEKYLGKKSTLGKFLNAGVPGLPGFLGGSIPWAFSLPMLGALVGGLSLGLGGIVSGLSVGIPGLATGGLIGYGAFRRIETARTAQATLTAQLQALAQSGLQPGSAQYQQLRAQYLKQFAAARGDQAANQAADGLTRLLDSIHALARGLEQPWFGTLGVFFNQLSSFLDQPSIRQLISQSSLGLQDFVRGTGAALSSPQTRRDFHAYAQAVRPIMDQFGQTTGNLIGGFLNFVRDFIPAAQVIGNFFVRWSEGVERFFAHFRLGHHQIELLKTVLHTVGFILGSLVGTAGRLMHDLAPLGAVLLHMASNVAKWIRSFVNFLPPGFVQGIAAVAGSLWAISRALKFIEATKGVLTGLGLLPATIPGGVLPAGTVAEDVAPWYARPLSGPGQYVLPAAIAAYIGYKTWTDLNQHRMGIAGQSPVGISTRTLYLEQQAAYSTHFGPHDVNPNQPQFDASTGKFVVSQSSMPRIVDYWQHAWGAIKNWGTDAWQFINTHVYAPITHAWDTVTHGLDVGWQHAWGSIKNWADDAWHWLHNNVYEPIRSVWNTVTGGIKKAWNDIWGAVKSAAQSAWHWIDSNIFQPILSAWHSITSGISKAWGAIWGPIQTVARGAVKIIKAILAPLVGTIERIINFLASPPPMRNGPQTVPLGGHGHDYAWLEAHHWRAVYHGRVIDWIPPPNPTPGTGGSTGAGGGATHNHHHHAPGTTTNHITVNVNVHGTNNTMTSEELKRAARMGTLEAMRIALQRGTMRSVHAAA